MVYFCPRCANLLLTDYGPSGNMRFYCRTCPYVFDIGKKLTRKVHLASKRVDDILGGDAAWENVSDTQVRCESCGNDRAYFFQMQTRSADEPMTIFYKCTKCGVQWKE